MTYDLLNVGDEGLLDILFAARQNGALVCVHAENHGMISWMGKRLVEKGYTAPKYHTHQPSARLGSRGVQPAHHLRRVHRSADHDLPRLHRRRRGRDPPGARPGPEGVRGDLPAIPVHDGARPRQARAGGRQVDVLAAAAQRKPTRRRSGRDWRWVTCNSSPPTMRPTPSMAAASSAPAPRRPSSRSPTACRASRRACRCCLTPWSRRAGSDCTSSSN